jgi:hypothetical protein
MIDITKIDESIARQLRRSIELNAQLLAQNKKLNAVVQTTIAALKPFRSQERGQLLLDAVDEPLTNVRLAELISKIDIVIDVAEHVISETDQF